MAIDFNTPDSLKSQNSEDGGVEPQDPVANAYPGPKSSSALYPMLSVLGVVLSCAALGVSLIFIKEGYSPKPVSLQCDPAMLQKVVEISQKMNAISREVQVK